MRYLLILILILFAAMNPRSVSAVQRNTVYAADYREVKLRNFFLKYNSPLVNYAGDFINAADKYELDYRLVPAITGVESTFGREIPFNSYNAYGWNGGDWYFESWPDSINYVSKALKENYVNRGASEVWQIAPVYNPVTPASWGTKVLRFEEMIEKTAPVVTETLSLRLTI
ncbi:MAG: hypothetical protein M1120_03815 [Patescibacteria group bacterium]|nr:hypothetical protein [Patescibacteria group bacterium]